MAGVLPFVKFGARPARRVGPRDTAPVQERQREELRAWARRLPEAPPSRQAAEAARRAIDLLLDEVDRLERELDARVEAERE